MINRETLSGPLPEKSFISHRRFLNDTSFIYREIDTVKKWSENDA